MKLMGLVALPLSLLAFTNSHERHDKWLQDVELTLSDPEYCQRIEELVVSPERDIDIVEVLLQIQLKNCQRSCDETKP